MVVVVVVVEDGEVVDGLGVVVVEVEEVVEDGEVVVVEVDEVVEDFGGKVFKMSSSEGIFGRLVMGGVVLTS